MHCLKTQDVKNSVSPQIAFHCFSLDFVCKPSLSWVSGRVAAVCTILRNSVVELPGLPKWPEGNCLHAIKQMIAPKTGSHTLPATACTRHFAEQVLRSIREAAYGTLCTCTNIVDAVCNSLASSGRFPRL